MARSSFALLACLVILVSPATLCADLLTPGGSVTPSAETALPTGSYFYGPTTISITGINALGETRFTGELIFAVYRESSSGFLDFLYQYHNDASSREPVQNITTTDFGTFTTDVTYISGTAPVGFSLGSTAATTATRSPDGGVVAFLFTTPHSILPGTTSRVMVINTDATNIDLGTTSVIDGGIDTVITRAPALPEPASLTLLGTALVGFVGFLGRRRLDSTKG